jgi:UDP-N-acetylmuramoyl-tripeptide--D-alanyl-D-alanine ligase
MKELLKKVIVTIITYEATLLLARTKPKIIGVTGSVGKTSVKDAIFHVLKGTMRVRKSEKSFNSEIGVPLTVLGLPNGEASIMRWIKNIIDGALLVLHPGMYPEVLVLEMGVDRPHDMERFTRWIKPHIVVLTRLPDVPVHVEYFEHPDDVAREKRKLVEALLPDGVFVFNQDDERVNKVAQQTFQQSIGYSRYSVSPFRATDDHILYETGRPVGFSFKLQHLNSEIDLFVMGSLGVQHAYTCAAAAAVASVFGLDLGHIQNAFKEYTTPPGRMRLIPGIKDTCIIDDTYNASPIASEQSLETLGDLRGVKRKIAVLGDMMELGQFSIREHERIGQLAQKHADILVTIGVRARGYVKGAREAGMDDRNIFSYDDSMSAARELQTFIQPGDCILVKGSQSVRAERFVEEIMAEPERAAELLVRQDAFWKAP